MTIELTYGLERIAMYLQGVDSVYDIVWSRWTEPDGSERVVTYGDVYQENEREFSRYNFEVSDADMLFRHFAEFEAEAERCLEARLPIPAYDYVLKCSHAFNMLDARGVISVTDRTAHIASVRDLARKVAALYLEVVAAPTRRATPTDDITVGASGGPRHELRLAVRDRRRGAALQDLSVGARAAARQGQRRGAGAGLRDARRGPPAGRRRRSRPRRLRRTPPQGDGGAAAHRGDRQPTCRASRAPRRRAFAARGSTSPLGPTARRPRPARASPAARVLRRSGSSARRVDGNEFVVAVIEAEQPRRPSVVLPDVCRRLITGLQIPRGMRWGARPAGADDYLRFSRPLRWLTCVFAGQPVPFDFYDLRAGDVTQGHRVLGRPLLVDRASHYERHLREQHVIADHDERRRLIVEGLDAAAAKLGGRWSDPAGVLEENIYLAEWPSVHAGGFDERHLRLPREVLVTAMQAHQRYCPVEDAAGGLLPAFLYVSNADPAAAALITHGNERVLEGRLDDAEFSYDRDLDEGLAAMAARLGEVVFHAKLGSLADKSARLVALTQRLRGPGRPGAAERGRGRGRRRPGAHGARSPASCRRP